MDNFYPFFRLRGGLKILLVCLLAGAATAAATKKADAATYTVTNTANENTDGSLRRALSQAQANGDIVSVAPELTGEIITLASSLPEITAGITINGNGVTIKGGGNFQILKIYAPEKTVTISRVHFTGGSMSSGPGGALSNTAGTLNLKACIFSGNSTTSTNTTSGGGALYNAGTISVQGCTFYNNTSSSTGGAFLNNTNTGTATITGCIFFGNTALSIDKGYVAYNNNTNGTLSSDGYNVYDVDSPGFTAATDDRQVSELPFSSNTFEPTLCSPANGLLPTTLPAGYPTNDFYGDTLTLSGAAGAVQGWIVVTSKNDDGAGTLRQAIATANAWAGHAYKKETPAIYFSPLLAAVADSIVLASALPPISLTTDLYIHGNGAKITGAGKYRILNVSAPGKRVTISRLHFANAAADSGAAILSAAGELVLNSCIFSENRATNALSAGGGAIYCSGAMSAMGCTFFQNAAAYRGGAIYQRTGTATLTGNIFYGNTAAENYSVACAAPTAATITSKGYNLYDWSYGFAFTHATDRQEYAPQLAPGPGPTTAGTTPVPAPFRPLASSVAATALTALPNGYPTEDFTGDAIPEGGAAGALQKTITPTSNYYWAFDYAAFGPGTLATSPASLSKNNQGLIYMRTDNSYYYMLVATPDKGATLLGWIVNGVETPGTGAGGLLLNVKQSKHLSVKALFAYVVNSKADNNNTGDELTTLREAITYANASCRSAVAFAPELAGDTLTLKSPLPPMTKTITVEGANIAISGAGKYRIMEVNAPAHSVTLRGLHLTGGQTENEGAAIRHTAGALSLQACILSGNRAAGSAATGAALYSCAAPLSLQACTFYRNASAYRGGAAYLAEGCTAGSVAGNIFYGNTAADAGSSLIYSAGAAAASSGYNRYSGTATGFTFSGTDDAAVSALPMDTATFRPEAEAQKALPAALPEGYPAKDFYGDPVEARGAAGAVQQQSAAHVPIVEEADPPSLPDGAIVVTSSKNKGTGTLRQALFDVPDGGTIYVDLAAGVSDTIRLTTTLAVSGKGFTIYGNGVKIYGGDSVRIMTIESAKTVTMHGVRMFKGKEKTSTSYGSALTFAGDTLNLYSCIFDNNSASVSAHAIYVSGTATVNAKGCTFYNNNLVGCIYGSSATLNLIGNLFHYAYNITSTASVVSGNTISSQYNVYESKHSFSGATTPANKNKEVNFLMFNTSSFCPTNAMLNILPDTLPEGYPATDFYNIPIRGGGSAGAVQGLTPGHEEDVTGTPPRTSYPASKPSSGTNVIYVTTIEDNSNSGTLRYALTQLAAITNGTIYIDPSLAGQTIVLTSSLPMLNTTSSSTRVLKIYGNGVKIRGNGFRLFNDGVINTSTSNSPSVYIYIHGVHFDGFTNSAIYIENPASNVGYKSLTLYSCIFSNNTAPNGGAISLKNGDDGYTLYCYAYGCTFYNNKSTNASATISGSYGGGGAIYCNATTTAWSDIALRLHGNIFYQNTAKYGSNNGILGGRYYSGNNDYCIFNLHDSYLYSSANLPITESPFVNLTKFTPKRIAKFCTNLPTSTSDSPSERYDFYGNLRAETAYAGAVEARKSSGVPSYLVYSTADAGEGSLRQAILNVNTDKPRIPRATIDFAPGMAGKTIHLKSALPNIYSNFLSEINGNGATISGGNGPYSILRIVGGSASGVKIYIRRLHFTGSGAKDGGALCHGSGDLYLQSCIFSNNHATGAGSSSGRGGAIFSSYSSSSSDESATNLYIYSCTFYGNSANQGSAIYRSSVYTGSSGVYVYRSIFYGNGGSAIGPIQPTTATYNLYDDGITFTGTGNKYSGALPVSPGSFRLLSGSAAANIASSSSGDYSVDFYGDPIVTSSTSLIAAGAVQSWEPSPGYALTCMSSGSGSVSAAATSAVNSAGLYPPNTTVTLTAKPSSAHSGLLSWTVNGVETPGEGDDGLTLAIAMNENKTVRAQFAWLVTDVNDKASGAPVGSLRAAIDSINSSPSTIGSAAIVIDPTLAGQTISLAAALPTITKGVTIEGNGITISGENTYQIMQIRTAVSTDKVSIRGVHFTKGNSSSTGAAIRITGGKLMLHLQQE